MDRSSTILDLMSNAIDQWLHLLSEGHIKELEHRLETAKKDLRILIEKDDERRISAKAKEKD